MAQLFRMMTYLNKLGPDNLGDGYATPVTFRWRIRDAAQFFPLESLPADLRPGHHHRINEMLRGDAAEYAVW